MYFQGNKPLLGLHQFQIFQVPNSTAVKNIHKYIQVPIPVHGGRIKDFTVISYHHLD